VQLDGSTLDLGENLSRPLSDERAELVREWVAEHRVRDEALAAEKGVMSDTLGAVDDLVRNHKVPRGDLLSQGSDSREGQNGLHSDVLERGNVGSGGHLGGSDGVRQTVSRDESDERARGELGNGHRRRGLAPWLASEKSRDDGRVSYRVDVDGLAIISEILIAETRDSHRGEVVEVVKASASNDTDEDCIFNERFQRPSSQ
jgi:hypothetical protein